MLHTVAEQSNTQVTKHCKSIKSLVKVLSARTLFWCHLKLIGFFLALVLLVAKNMAAGRVSISFIRDENNPFFCRN